MSCCVETVWGLLRVYTLMTCLLVVACLIISLFLLVFLFLYVLLTFCLVDVAPSEVLLAESHTLHGNKARELQSKRHWHVYVAPCVCGSMLDWLAISNCTDMCMWLALDLMSFVSWAQLHVSCLYIHSSEL